jgi:hypothetical protein
MAAFKGSPGGNIDPAAAAKVAAVPQSKAPELYFYKLPLALAILSGFLCTFASPFVSHELQHKLLMVLVVAVSVNGFCGIGQVVRTLSATLRLRGKLLDPALQPPSPKTLLDYEPSDSGGHQGLRTRLLMPLTALNHVFIIPNYKEDIETLSATLANLGSHPTAGNYTIVLAMEAKEAEAVEKVNQLQASFEGCFKSIIYTMHTMQHGEMPGKASNVNAAVRQFYPQAKGDKDSYMLTVIDADARVPYLYVQELESKAVQVRAGGQGGQGGQAGQAGAATAGCLGAAPGRQLAEAPGPGSAGAGQAGQQLAMACSGGAGAEAQRAAVAAPAARR